MVAMLVVFVFDVGGGADAKKQKLVTYLFFFGALFA